jgi:hypothetical protein
MELDNLVGLILIIRDGVGGVNLRMDVNGGESTILRGVGADGRLQKAEEALAKMKIKRDQK